VESVIRVESNFEARAVSAKGARGLMQLMPKTAAPPSPIANSSAPRRPGTRSRLDCGRTAAS
jgi:hypothetical protein